MPTAIFRLHSCGLLSSNMGHPISLGKWGQLWVGSKRSRMARRPSVNGEGLSPARSGHYMRLPKPVSSFDMNAILEKTIILLAGTSPILLIG